MKVKVIFRQSADQTRETAYLHYSIKGDRQRLTTGITIPTKPNTSIEKAEREEGLRMLDALRAKTEMQIAEGKTGIKTTFGKRTDFVKFVEAEIEKDKSNVSKSSHSNRKTFFLHLKNAFPKGLDCKQISEETTDDFIKYLNGCLLKKTSISHYMRLFAKFVHLGQSKELINNFKVVFERAKPPKREFLTNEELTQIEEFYKNIIPTKRSPKVKEAFKIFLFCCNTGLRVSDAITLQYNHIVRSVNNSLMIRKEQQKTGNDVLIPLNENSKNYIDLSKVGLDEKVFAIDNYNVVNNIIVAKNPLKKKLTTHIARHTFAVQLLERGADIYSVSRLLGHTSIKTTEIYADMTTTKANAIVSLLDK